MREIRIMTILLDSAATDEQWDGFVKGIVDVAEQDACDLAAACENDNYSLDVITEKGSYYA